MSVPDKPAVPADEDGVTAPSKIAAAKNAATKVDPRASSSQTIPESADTDPLNASDRSRAGSQDLNDVQGLRGLSQKEVAALTKQGLSNQFTPRATRTLRQILRANVFTLFNAILGVCIVVTLIFGHWADAVFGIVMVVNALTGIVSELRAKRVLEKISILQENPIQVIREGKRQAISPRQIVQGDLLLLRRGDQVPADGEVVSTRGFYLDESNLTGESIPRPRGVGEKVYSGAAVVAGDGYVQVSAVGSRSWANAMAIQVKKFKMAHSELEEGINKILTIITYCLPLVIVLLAVAQVRNLGGLSAVTWKNIGPVVVAVVAGIVGMIPQGLVLLTSVNFAAASLKLARQGVLIQELPAVEVLARVDTLCLDKTGTLTTGEIAARGFVLPGRDELVPAGELDLTAQAALAVLTKERENDTSAAIYERLDSDLKKSPLNIENPQLIPFDSARKWSGLVSAGDTWVLGAPEIVLGQDPSCQEQTATWAQQGARVLALARGRNQEISPQNPALPENLELLALIVLTERLREDAAQTLDFFREEGVEVLIISGDNPVTVAALAGRLGVETTGYDARKLPEDEEGIAQILKAHRVFGRVTPEQKRALVHALQASGKCVAMTGDGVNDALALKDADLGIAMGNAAQATKSAAKAVLLDSRFSALPQVLGEGRRVLGNMERVSTLFLSKTTYAALLALIVGVLGVRYPYLPRHLTLISSSTIGIPAFFLALAPSNRRYRPGFLRRVGQLALPAGLLCGVTSIGAYLWLDRTEVATSAATIVLAIGALGLLAILSQPLPSWRGGLLTAMIALVLAAITVPVVRDFFALQVLSFTQWLVVGFCSLISLSGLALIGTFWERRHWPDHGSGLRLKHVRLRK